MRCPNCNGPIEPYDRFCESCGCVLSSAPSQAPVPSETPAASDAPVNELHQEPSPYEATEKPAKPAASDDEMNAVDENPVAPTATPLTSAAYVPTAAAVAAAATENAASTQASYASPSSTAENGPYAAAVDASGGGSSYAQPAYAQPIYAQPNYTQQPQSPYAQPDFGTAAAAGYAYGAYEAQNPNVGPKASAVGFGLAVASLVIGCIGLLSFGILGFICIIGLIMGIVALVMRAGYKKRGEFDTHASSTLGLGVTGIVLNVLAMLIFILLMVVVAVTEM